MYKKTTYLGLVIWLCSLNSFAGDGKSFVTLKSSVSQPLGDYSKKDLSVGCFTTTGVTFAAEGAWFFSKSFGVGLDVSYSLHPVDAVAVATATVRNNPVLQYAFVRSEPYTMLNLMGGFYYSYNITKKISVMPKLLAGIMFGKTPFQLFETTYFMLGPDYFKITSARDESFALKPGLSINYDLSSCIAIGLNIDYTMSNLSFGFYTGNGFEKRNRKIRYLDVGLGLIIKL